MYVLRCLLFSILLAVSGGCRPHRTAPITPPAPSSSANWMHDNIATFGSLPLNKLILPGSHDSAMYASGFPQSLAQTQRLSIYQQLSAGIRYFDLRPRWHGNQIVMFHGPLNGPPLLTILADIRRFMVENHNELILLKFSHYDSFNDAHYQTLISQLQESLNPWLFSRHPPYKRLADLTLAEYLNSGRGILILSDDHFTVSKPTPGIWTYRDYDSAHPEQADLTVFDQYANTTEFETMKRDQLHKFESFTGRCVHNPNIACDLFLLSWTLTPMTHAVDCAKQANEQFAAALRSVPAVNSFGRSINVLYTDDADTARTTDLAIQMNTARAGH